MQLTSAEIRLEEACVLTQTTMVSICCWQESPLPIRASTRPGSVHTCGAEPRLLTLNGTNHNKERSSFCFTSVRSDLHLNFVFCSYSFIPHLSLCVSSDVTQS